MKQKLTFVVSTLNFPIVEGTQRQVWEFAKRLFKFYDVKIITYTSASQTKNSIPIINQNEYDFSSTDILFFFNPTFSTLIKFIKIKSGKRFVFLTGGKIKGIIGLIPNLLFKIFQINKVLIYSNTQIHKLKKYIILPPLKPNLKSKVKKSSIPTLLYMHSMAEHKGFFDCVDAFKLVQKKRKDIILKLITYDQDLKYDDPNIICVKKYVNPKEELSKAWILLYPPQKAQSTLAVPLLYFESIQCKTPFISTTINTISKYFNNDFLVKPKNPEAIATKIIQILDNYKLYQKKLKTALNITWTNEEIIDKFKKILIS